MLKMLTEQMNEHYQAVLRDLEDRRSRIQKELSEVETTIGAIRRLLPTQANLFPNGSPQIIAPTVASKYSGMSVRWAILSLLAEDAYGPMPTSQIADNLLKGGISSSGKSFSSNVSAVLSVMANTRKEIEQVEGSYQLTAHGKGVWEGIKGSEQYRNRGANEAIKTPGT